MSKLIKMPFNYPGSKYSKLSWLYKRFPPHDSYKTFIDVFGGSGIVVLNKKPSKIDIYNDLNSYIYNLFKQLRENHKEFLKKVKYSMYSRELFLESRRKIEEDDFKDDFDKAVYTYYYLNMTMIPFMGKQTGFLTTIYIQYLPNHKIFKNKLKSLPILIDRFQDIVIENIDCFKLINKYKDNSDTFLYLDPPYSFTSDRSRFNLYKDEFTEEKQERLLKLILTCKCKVAISGYESKLYNKLLRDWKVYKYRTRSTIGMSSKRKTTKTECLWTNY